MLAAVVAATLVATTVHAGPTSRYLGKPFPDFEARDAITGEPFSLADYRGKVVIVDFWATWCGPCIRELPTVRRTYAKYRDEGLAIVSISLDSNAGRFRSFVAKNGMDWAHVMEGGKWKTRLAVKYNIHSIPAMFVLDHEGTCIAERVRGPALERVVSRAVADIPAVVATGPVDVRPERLTAAREQLVDVSRPLERLVELNQRAQHAVAALDPAAADRTWVAQYRKTHALLSELRAALFSCGALGAEPPRLPPNALGDGQRPAPEAIEASRAQASALRKTRGMLGVHVNSLSAKTIALDRRLDALLLAVHAGPVAPEVARDCHEATRQSAELRSMYREGWQEQLKRTSQMLSNIARQPDAMSLQPELNTCRRELAEIRRDLHDANGNATRTEQAGERFVKLCPRILVLHDQG
jgi:thiol-disulfide isomerase/thioredoxin